MVGRVRVREYRAAQSAPFTDTIRICALIRHGGVNATMPLGAVLAVDGAKGLVEIPTAEEVAAFEDDSKL